VKSVVPAPAKDWSRRARLLSPTIDTPPVRRRLDVHDAAARQVVVVAEEPGDEAAHPVGLVRDAHRDAATMRPAPGPPQPRP
jgi:hypothetical protein